MCGKICQNIINYQFLTFKESLINNLFNQVTRGEKILDIIIKNLY